MFSNSTPPRCMEYNNIIQHYYRSKGSVEWSSLLSVRIVFGFIYSLILVGGVVGNGGVIGVLVFGRHRLSARNVLLLNLMCADLLLCFTAVPITPVVIVWKRWFLGSIMCRCLPLAQSASVMIVSWTLAAIAIDKFLHITYISLPPMRRRHATAFAASSWGVGLSLNVPYTLAYKLLSGADIVGPGVLPFCGHFCTEKWWDIKEFKKIYGTVVLCIQFAIPMIIIAFCYTRILLIVKRDSIISNKEYSGSLSRRQHERAWQIQRRVTCILIAMVLAFLLSWAPITVMNILRDYATVPSFVHRQVYFYALCAHSVAMSSILWNPILCFWLTRKKEAHPKAHTTASMMELRTSVKRSRSMTLGDLNDPSAAILLRRKSNSVNGKWLKLNLKEGEALLESYPMLTAPVLNGDLRNLVEDVELMALNPNAQVVEV